MRSLLFLVVLTACSEEHAKERVWVEKMVTAVHESGELPLSLPVDGEALRELTVARLAIQQSTAIAMENAVTVTGTRACAHGRLIGARDDPTLAVELDTATWTLVRVSVDRRCHCAPQGCWSR